MELTEVLSFADGPQIPFAMVVLGNHQVNSAEELDQAGMRLAIQAVLLAYMDAGSLDLKQAVSADFYHLK